MELMASVGDLAIFHNRVVEIVAAFPDSDGPRGVVEFTDGGGIKRRFVLGLSAFRSLKLLGKNADKVLDDLSEIESRADRPYMQMKLRTERWFADPRPGDLFQEFLSFWVCVDEVPEDGRVIARTTVRFTEDNGWEWEQKVYPSHEAFREAFYYPAMPGYSVLAHSSRRTSEPEVVPKT